MRDTVVLVIGGDQPDLSLLEEVPTDATVLAVDGGLDHAISLGLEVDLVVGDMDSASPKLLEQISPDRRVRHPADKDRTDLEIAMDLIVARHDVDKVIVLGGIGGRIDHLLGNATVLCSPRYADLDIDWVSAGGRAHVVRARVEVHGVPGQVVSLVPMGGDAIGVTTTGLRWPLEHATLPFGEARGISNQFVSPVGSVSLESGVLLVVQPDPA